MRDAAIMSGPRSISKSSLINAADRFRRLGPPSVRAWLQFRHLQKASGKAFAAAVPRNVMVVCWNICSSVSYTQKHTCMASPVGSVQRSHSLPPSVERTHVDRPCCGNSYLLKWRERLDSNPRPGRGRRCGLHRHDPHRIKTTLMEEVAHIHLRHSPTGLTLSMDGLRMRGYDKKQEHEAYGVGAAALLPWGAFFPAINRGWLLTDWQSSLRLVRSWWNTA